MVETAILVSNAIMVGLMLGFGVWIRHIVNQQLRLKDTTIQSKDAEISRLKGETAPNIAKAYGEMVKHADKMTERFNQLQKELEEKAKGNETRDRIMGMIDEQAGEASGLYHANQILIELVGEHLTNPKREPTILEAISVPQEASNRIVQLYNQRIDFLLKAKNKMKELIATREEKES